MFADIAFPTAIRRLFTYSVPEEFISALKVGIRVWVPYRNHFAIGVVVSIHENRPEFQTKEIKRLLDTKPIVSSELLKLTHWIHNFYYCSWGEVLQAALPSGLNYVSKTYVKTVPDFNQSLSEKEDEVFKVVEKSSELQHKEAQKRWRSSGLLKVYNGLIKKGVLELWDEPDLKSTIKTEKWIDWKDSSSSDSAASFIENQNRSFSWIDGLKKLSDISFPIRKKDLKKELGLSDYVIKQLIAKNWIREFEKEVVQHYSDFEFNPDAIKSLNDEQNAAYKAIKNAIDKNSFANFLLKGITGSGKTEVYIHAIKHVVQKGKSAIVLVPEIALTPQTVARFYQIFGDKISVLHSRLTDSEKLQNWKQIENGEKSIVIGPRSAVYAPVTNLGIIILDEEHDSSYKQIDPAPRYHAREVAIVRANQQKAIVIMGSATPSLQALTMAELGKATLLELKKRHADAKLPNVELIDLKQYTGAMKGPFSIPLFNAIENSLKNNEQVILLYNRRGFANYIQCNSCGHIPVSPESSVSLTYHKHRNMLMCHYSGYSRKLDTNCEQCGSSDLIIKGSGTQKIEDDLNEWFPDAKVLRFDKDTTSRKGAHADILGKFSNQEAEILVGTQLVAKGHDFPNVTTVGVVDADTEQAFPSYTSSERLFQLLSQVAGRSGRADKRGSVFIQTRNPDNVATQFAKSHDFDGFANQELRFRKDLNYPPYSRLIKFIIKGKTEQNVIQASHLIRSILEQLLNQNQILGPSASAISWLNNNYFWEVTVKIDPNRGEKYISAFLSEVKKNFDLHSKLGSTVRLNINVDSIS